MKLKNFNWDEFSVDQIVSDDTRYTTYTGYGSHDYHIDAVIADDQAMSANIKREELTSL